MHSKRSSTNALSLGDSIRFGRDGNYTYFEPEGFGPEDSSAHTWNDGYSAILSFQTVAPIERGRISISVDPFIAERVPSQDLFVYLNGLWMGFSRIRRADVLHCPIGPRYVAPGRNLLALVMPNATSPKEIGTGSDLRRLGFAFREIALVTDT
jgi:hypothetical protein